MTANEASEYAGTGDAGLAERFARVPAGGHVVVTETGFGAGLGFLAAWRLWRKVNAAPYACLHFRANEPCPLPRENLIQALDREPELAALAAELIEAYPPTISGTHRLVLDRGRVRLTLCFGDIKSTPAKPESGHHDQPQVPASVGIVGAGMAGCLLANNLAGRGFQVTLIDQAESVAAQASGNRQGALYVKLGVDYTDQTELALASLLFSQRYYQRFKNDGWHPTGLLQLAYNAAEADRQARFLGKNQYPPAVFEPVSADRASALAGIPIPHGGLWFPASGWLEPAKLCQRLTAGQPAITQRMGFAVASLQQQASGWRLTSGQGDTLSFDRVVLCAGADTPELIPLEGQYRLKRIRGQITEVPQRYLNNPSVVVCGPGYINPALDGSALVGATFDLHDTSVQPSQQSDHANLSMLAGLLPDALTRPDLTEMAANTRGRVAFRCTTHDYQPIAGPMKTRDGTQLEGVYLLTGLGSKGLTYSPLLAEYLGDLISGQPPCLPENLIKRIETQRIHRPLAH